MRRSWNRNLAGLVWIILFAPAVAADADVCTGRTLKANVIAFDQPITVNRLGSSIPGGMIFALAGDAVSSRSGESCWFEPGSETSCEPGKVNLRAGKRPRPMVLRLSEGDCLQVSFTNLLTPFTGTPQLADMTTRTASLHVQGLNWVTGPNDDGSFVGRNPESLADPGEQRIYTLFAGRRGTYLLYSSGDDWTANPVNWAGGQLKFGLFGAVNVEPSGYRGHRIDPSLDDWDSEFYRSQVTEQDLCLASRDGRLHGGVCRRDRPAELPVIRYDALYPAGVPDPSLAGRPILDMVCRRDLPHPETGEKVCVAGEIVASDATAVITGPGAGAFPGAATTIDGVEALGPELRPNYAYPERLEPYREFTIFYHESFAVAQAFPYYNQGGSSKGGGISAGGEWSSLNAASDNFGINYSMVGLSSPILANRLGAGVLATCTDCKYEEFFLSSWTAGDPGLLVDNPASQCISATGELQDCARANYARYPDDPSNVFHSYMGDHLKFRVLHGGQDLHHLHHQHAHQWLATANSPHGDYLDSQSIGPGSGFTLEMVYGGSGNVNQTVGDSIFHCHFYPHFASGMWGLWRVHDVFEGGTILGQCRGDSGSYPCPRDRENPGAPGGVEHTRALPDGEIVHGTPIPALVPLPTLAMAPMPAPVRLAGGGSQVEVELVTRPDESTDRWASSLTDDRAWNPMDPPPGQDWWSPGYPFFIPGIAGSRPPHPPLDFAYACSDNGRICRPGFFGQRPDLSACASRRATCEPMDGGLPRSVMHRGDADTVVSFPQQNKNLEKTIANTDFSKKILKASATALPNDGSLVEKMAMRSNARREWDTPTPAGTRPGQGFLLNGLPPVPGAPYADPCIQYRRAGGGAQGALPLRYLGVDLQVDTIFNKEGWHFPQQRLITLWGDAWDTLEGKKAPEPLFLRVNSMDCVEYVLANLVPNVYELDDFQVRTPTDILGQHIHLVKFDVTSSDGAANGWNYEDGTFAPNEVTERIAALTAGSLEPAPGMRQAPALRPGAYVPFFGPGPGGSWIGSQATIQRWYDDPLLTNRGRCSSDLETPCTEIDLSLCPAAPYGETLTCRRDAGRCSNAPDRACVPSTTPEDHCGDRRAICIPQEDRTIRSVFTHDHFSPSTHQQAGLYAALVVEPRGSVWRDNQTGTIFGGFNPVTGRNLPGTRRASFGSTGISVLDGGPTSWQAAIEMPEGFPMRQEWSYREFLLQIQDSAMFYQPFSVPPFDFAVATPAGARQFDDLVGCEGREPWETCGFCSNNGVCIDASSGRATGERCFVPPPRFGLFLPEDPCGAGQRCLLDAKHLVGCTQDDVAACAFGIPADQLMNRIQTCNYVTGVPHSSWVAGIPLGAGTGNAFVDTPEAIVFEGATNNFSFNYRNEPLFPRISEPLNGRSLPGAMGDLGLAYSSRVPRLNPRGDRCSAALDRACSRTAPCPSYGGFCEGAGFCSDNWALCTGSNTSLCRFPAAATCLDQPGAGPYPPLLPGVEPRPSDPFTPLLRAYAGDDVQVRTLVGAHINPHNFTFHGINWPMEPSFVDAGWRNSQVMGISEHFELLLKVPPTFSVSDENNFADFLYQPGAAAIEQASGNWGLLRAFNEKRPDLHALPQNEPPPGGFPARHVCPDDARTQRYDVVAVNMAWTDLAANIAPVNSIDDLATTSFVPLSLVYNKRRDLTTRDAMVFALVDDPKLKCLDLPASITAAGDEQHPLLCAYLPDREPEPLVLRAGAGDCVEVTVHNSILGTGLLDNTSGAAANYAPVLKERGVFATPNTYPPDLDCMWVQFPGACGGIGQMPCCSQPASDISRQVGLRPQLVTYDPRTSDGFNAGFNDFQTVPANGTASATYRWYAGFVDVQDGESVHIPIEFGAANLLAPDTLNHYLHGLFGALVVEPEGATWESDTDISTVVRYTDHQGRARSFREFVLFFQDGVRLVSDSGDNLNAFNYKSELLAPPPPTASARFCSEAQCLSALQQGGQQTDFSCYFSENAGSAPAVPWCVNAAQTGCEACAFEAETPTFQACAGEEVRFRVLHPGGTNTNSVFELFGHSFSDTPYMTLPEHCRARQQHANLHASQMLGDENLCGSLDWTLEAENSPLWDRSLDTWEGSQMGIGPSNHFDVLISSAGGELAVAGDYLYRSYPSFHLNLGQWGIFRVLDPTSNDPSKSRVHCLATGGY